MNNVTQLAKENIEHCYSHFFSAFLGGGIVFGISCCGNCLQYVYYRLWVYENNSAVGDVEMVDMMIEEKESDSAWVP